MRTGKALFVLIIMLGAYLSGCCPVSRPCTKQCQTQVVNHIVLCWLKEPGNMEHRKIITDTARSFKKIPGVVDVTVGQPVPGSRKIVDDSFDVGLCMTFKSIEDLNSYIEHPVHKKASKEILFPVIKKAVVYDFIDIMNTAKKKQCRKKCR